MRVFCNETIKLSRLAVGIYSPTAYNARIEEIETLCSLDQLIARASSVISTV